MGRYWSLVIVALVICMQGCGQQLRYEVMSHVDLEQSTFPEEATFGVASMAADSTADPLLEKNILHLIRAELAEKGWSETPVDSAQYTFSVSFDMDKESGYSQQGVYTYYWQGRQYQAGGKGQSVKTFTRFVRINCFRGNMNDVAPENLVWSADCVSEGSTPDIFLAAKYMVPFAMQQFPAEGTWSKKVAVQKK